MYTKKVYICRGVSPIREALKVGVSQIADNYKGLTSREVICEIDGRVQGVCCLGVLFRVTVRAHLSEVDGRVPGRCFSLFGCNP